MYAFYHIGFFVQYIECLLLFVHSTKQSVLLQNLHPNTRYEFVVRLHVDHMSSSWSSVVYHQTLPAGKTVYSTICSICSQTEVS